MNRYFDIHFNSNIVTIHPGEYYSTNEDVYISTVLGSCVSIAFFDSEAGLGGLNHFMLPSSSESGGMSERDAGVFGDYAMELLLNEMYKKGAKKSRLSAKVFGGGNVINSGSRPVCMTGINNVNFALGFLDREKIPVLAQDVGGIFPRKIFVHPLTKKVYLKRIQNSQTSLAEVRKREAEYAQLLKEEQAKRTDVVWF